MTREQRIEQVAKVVFRYRDPCHADRHPDDYTVEDLAEASRFIEMLDAQHSSGRE